jgi:hypothetical protein
MGNEKKIYIINGNGIAGDGRHISNMLMNIVKYNAMLNAEQAAIDEADFKKSTNNQEEVNLNKMVKLYDLNDESLLSLINDINDILVSRNAEENNKSDNITTYDVNDKCCQACQIQELCAPIAKDMNEAQRVKSMNSIMDINKNMMELHTTPIQSYPFEIKSESIKPIMSEARGVNLYGIRKKRLNKIIKKAVRSELAGVVNKLALIIESIDDLGYLVDDKYKEINQRVDVLYQPLNKILTKTDHAECNKGNAPIITSVTSMPLNNDQSDKHDCCKH